MERSEKGVIFNIKRFAVHDGPGIRTAVFLKGCPLSCVWCHNPEGINRDISVWYNNNICIACGRCIEACPEEALSFRNSETKKRIHINKDNCKVSGECVAACPTGAISFTGRQVTVTDVMNEVLKDQKYFTISGGGATLTGGEPLEQPEFSLALLKACKDNNIDTAIETCLHCDREVLESVIPFTDHFIADLKIYDPEGHEKYTGKNNLLIKDNLHYLIKSGRDVTVRMPVIPGITGSTSNRQAVVDFIRNIDPGVPVEFLDYNRLTGSKYMKMGIPFFLESKS